MNKSIILPPQKSGYSFWDFWIAYMLTAVFLYIIFRFPGARYNDMLNMRELNAKGFFSLLTTTAAAFLAILFAAFLLSFQLLNKEARRRKEGNVLYNSTIIGFTCLSLFLIIASTICYVTIPDFSQDKDLTLGYFLLYVFLVFVVLIVYIVSFLLHDTNSLEKIQDEISMLHAYDFIAVTKAYEQDNWVYAENLNMISIRDEILYAIRDNDSAAMHILMKDLTNKALEMIVISSERRRVENIISALTVIWKDATFATTPNSELAFYKGRFDSIAAVYRHAAEKKIPLEYFSKLRIYYHEVVDVLIRKKDIEILRKAVDVLYYSAHAHLKDNCPVEGDLHDLLKLYQQQPKPDRTSSDIQWEKISEIIYDMSRLQERAIEHSMKDLYIHVHRRLSRILKLIIDNGFPVLGTYQRAFFYTYIIGEYLMPNGEKALEAGLFEDATETFRLDSRWIAAIIENTPIASPNILGSLGDYLIKAHRACKLQYFRPIREFGTIPQLIASQYLMNTTVSLATRYVFNVLKLIKEEIEQRNVVTDGKAYREIHIQLQSLSKTLKEQEKNVFKFELKEEIDICLSSFKAHIKPQQPNIAPYIIPWQ